MTRGSLHVLVVAILEQVPNPAQSQKEGEVDKGTTEMVRVMGGLDVVS